MKRYFIPICLVVLLMSSISICSAGVKPTFDNNVNYQWVWSNDQLSCYIDKELIYKNGNNLTVNYAIADYSNNVVYYVHERFDSSNSTFTILDEWADHYSSNFQEKITDYVGQTFNIEEGSMHEALFISAKKLSANPSPKRNPFI